MNAMTALALAMLPGSIAFASPASAASDLIIPIVLRTQFPVACASGYSPDANGNCQSNSPIVDSRCQPGFLPTPAPWGAGYQCVPIPEGY